MLQVAPSKTDAERLLLVSPELAEVLTAIIFRVRAGNPALPLVCAYDVLEQTWSPPMPFLFQWRYGSEDRPIGRSYIRECMVVASQAAQITAAGETLEWRPHDFRRIFVTDALRFGLPPHIAAKICGHALLDTTMGYAAIYPEDVIAHHRAFIARRRTERPGEEYRDLTATDDPAGRDSGARQQRASRLTRTMSARLTDVLSTSLGKSGKTLARSEACPHRVHLAPRGGARRHWRDYGRPAHHAAISAGQRPARGFPGIARASGPCAARPRVAGCSGECSGRRIMAGQRTNIPRMYLHRLTRQHCDAEDVLQLPGALVRRLERLSAPRANRIRGRPKTGIRLGQGVLNPC
jgi:hypothetical protein